MALQNINVVNNEIPFEFTNDDTDLELKNPVDENTLNEISDIPNKYYNEGYSMAHYVGETFVLKSFRVQKEDKKNDIPAFGVFDCVDGNSISLTALCRRGNGITWKFDEPKTGVNIAKYVCLLLANDVKITLKISKILLGKGKKKDGTTFESKTYIFEPVTI